MTAEISPDQNEAFAQLGTPAIDFQGRDYRQLVHDIVRDKGTSYALRKRIIEDDGRDPLDTLKDAELLHALQALRFASSFKARGGATKSGHQN